MELFNNYNHLGFHSPYYLTGRDGKLEFNRSNKKILNGFGEKEIDVVGVIELLSTGFCFGDRTLVSGIRRTPWMASPNDLGDGWNYASVPPHGDTILNDNEIVDCFYKLLRQELINYIEGFSKIGILLTGGMDSRIVACVLNDVLKEEFPNKEVYAFTWGSSDSRDVVYAQRIANKFNWSWEHLEVNSDQIRKNMELIMDEGCEFTPIHLHAMSKVASKTYLDCVLAGSFGDSVGRGEYSGIKATGLSSLRNLVKNVSSLFNKNIFNSALQQVDGDLSAYHKLFPCGKPYQLFEQDQQIHYMRRMLNPCMNIIDKKIPLYQMFTAPSVFGFIWGLHPSLRTDNIYRDLLQKYNPYLLEIPWARTGLRYPLQEGQPDQFKKKHHDYAKMIREEFLPDITSAIKKYELKEFNIFNVDIINDLIKYNKHYPISGSVYYEERLLWLACFAKYLRDNGIKASFSDDFSFSSRLSAGKKYFSKYFYRSLKV